MNPSAAMATQDKTTGNANTAAARRLLKSEPLWLVWLVLLAVACSPHQERQGSFVRLPAAGWDRSLPVTFTPAYGDSTAAYDIALAVRHTVDYPYRNLTLVVDLIGDSARVQRCRVNFDLADAYGNWRGTGFGALYQGRLTVARGVRPAVARRVVVWQAMDSCPVLTQVQDLGMIVSTAQ